MPSDTYTLCQLARLSDERFDKLLESGAINPSMKRGEASAENRKEKKAGDEKRILNLKPKRGKKCAISLPGPSPWLLPRSRPRRSFHKWSPPHAL